MTKFLSSLLSKKLGFAIAAEALIHTLHTTAETKAMLTALVAVVYIVMQAYVDSKTPPEAQ